MDEHLEILKLLHRHVVRSAVLQCVSGEFEFREFDQAGLQSTDYTLNGSRMAPKAIGV